MAELKRKPREYHGERLTVRYDIGLCMHASECIKGGLTSVFDRDRRPWILPDGADPERVIDIVERCPSGALTYQRLDQSAPQETAETNSVRPHPNGALYLRGDLALKDGNGELLCREPRLALCRCGHSRNRPFCDYSHYQAGFEDPGSLGDSALSQEIIDTEAPLEISANRDGPLLLRGPFALRSANQEAIVFGDRGRLCRCGKSANKPYCDDSHKRAGFETEP